MDIFQLFISAIFVNNIVLAQYLGNCPYLGCSKEKGVALGMGGAVIFVIIVATACTWLMQRYVLEPFGLGYLQTIVFIVVIASLVQFVEMFLKKMVPPLYAALGIFLPLITTNCAVMGVAILVQREEYDMSIWYDERYEIKLGGTDELAYKIRYLCSILDQLSEFQAGTIDLTQAAQKRATFQPAA